MATVQAAIRATPALLPPSQSRSSLASLSSANLRSQTANTAALSHSASPHGSRKGPLVVRSKAASDMKTELMNFQAAERRWQAQVREGKVKSMTPKEAGYSYQLADYVLLDVRPSFEREKGWVKESVWVPAFEPDRSLDALGNKVTTFLFGGWWSGNQVTKRNERFMADVVAKVPKGSNVIVTCQRGLRSLAACEHLYKAGYRNLYWINGGLDAAEEEDFTRDGPVPLKFAGLGGFSEFIGMTDPQRRKAQQEGLGYRAIFFGRIAGTLIAVDLLLLGLQQLSALIHGDVQ